MTRTTFTWQLHWPTTLFAFALLPCLIALGVWQLHRADEKRALLARFEARREAPPLVDAQLDAGVPAYTRVLLTGTFDNAHVFLLDNRISRGRVGFDVLAPLHLTGSGRTVLVNRGWIAGDPARRTLPAVPAVAGVVSLTGYIYRGDGSAGVVAAASDTWPRVIEAVDMTRQQAQLGQPLLPFTVRIDADANAALVAHWPLFEVGPQRHIGYAVQWFLMAAVLMLLWLLRSSNIRECWFGDATDATPRD